MQLCDEEPEREKTLVFIPKPDQPVEQPPADHKYTRRQVERLAKSPDQGKDFFQRAFPGYTIREIRPEYYEQTGWHIYLKMWKNPVKNVDKSRKRGKMRN